MPNKNKSYILAVKHNLRTFLYTANYKIDPYGSFAGKDENNIKFNTLTHLCNELQKKAANEDNTYWLSKPDDKLKKILSDEFDTVDPYFVNEICELYHFPVEKVFCAVKVTPEQALEILSDLAKETDMKQKPYAPLSKLTHKSYFGDFYGYTFDHNPNEEDTIIKFKLSIFEDENGVPRAEYIFHNRNGEKQIFSGTPYYLSDLETICIEMSADNHRRYQYLYFNGARYHAKKMTYKSGVCVRTSTVSKSHEPDVKSFVITGCELPDEVAKKIILGLLKMTSNDFYVLASQLQQLETEHANIKLFHERYSPDIRLIDNAVFLVKERKIIENVRYESKSERIFAFECLAVIRAHALAPNRVLYRNAEADYNYFHQLEQEVEELT